MCHRSNCRNRPTRSCTAEVPVGRALDVPLTALNNHLRPVVALMRAPRTAQASGVIYGGSPISAADAAPFGQLGSTSTTSLRCTKLASRSAASSREHPSSDKTLAAPPIYTRRGRRQPVAPARRNRISTRIDASTSMVEVPHAPADV